MSKQRSRIYNIVHNVLNKIVFLYMYVHIHIRIDTCTFMYTHRRTNTFRFQLPTGQWQQYAMYVLSIDACASLCVY